MKAETVRQYEDEDLSQVAEIAANLGFAIDRESAEAAIGSACRYDNYRIFVAEFEGQVVGLLVLELTSWHRHLADIHWIAVRYECWRKGFGSSLIKEVGDYARKNGVVRIQAATGPDHDSVPFYIKNGFTPRGILKQWGKDGEDCLILAKDL